MQSKNYVTFERKDMKASHSKRVLQFRIPGGTSRGVLTQKETWYLILRDADKIGIGECAMFRGLSIDDRVDYEDTLQWVCANIAKGEKALLAAMIDYPSIRFGIEQAFLSLESPSSFELFPSPFTRGEAAIPINGLIWMGPSDFMMEQVHEKITAGFRTIKLKVGALNFGEELEILHRIREHYGRDLSIRVDANGAFSPQAAAGYLERLAKLDIHSIEQPIAVGQWDKLAKLCSTSSVPIALDEELIPITKTSEKQALLDSVKPAFLILKPSLLGGFNACEEWIALAEARGVGWWVTSALESNIGLNAIAQWTYGLGSETPQGLGTGGLFTNNIKSPLEVKSGTLQYNPGLYWETQLTEELCI